MVDGSATDPVTTRLARQIKIRALAHFLQPPHAQLQTPYTNPLCGWFLVFSYWRTREQVKCTERELHPPCVINRFLLSAMCSRSHKPLRRCGSSASSLVHDHVFHTFGPIMCKMLATEVRPGRIHVVAKPTYELSHLSSTETPYRWGCPIYSRSIISASSFRHLNTERPPSRLYTSSELMGNPRSLRQYFSVPLASTLAGLKVLSAQSSNLYPRSCRPGSLDIARRWSAWPSSIQSRRSFDPVLHSGRSETEGILVIVLRVPITVPPSSLAVFSVLPPLGG